MELGVQFAGKQPRAFVVALGDVIIAACDEDTAALQAENERLREALGGVIKALEATDMWERANAD